MSAFSSAAWRVRRSTPGNAAPRGAAPRRHGVVCQERRRPRATHRALARTRRAPVPAIRGGGPRGRTGQPPPRPHGPLPPSAEAARAGTAAVRALGAAAGAACAHFGIGVDFAPVVDVARPEGWLGSEERCLGGTPAEVQGAAAAYLQGLESFGVSGCLKHYPGLGSGAVDSHRELPLWMTPRRRTRRCSTRCDAGPSGDGGARTRARARRRRVPRLAVANRGGRLRR